jgi:hypothetical protein
MMSKPRWVAPVVLALSLVVALVLAEVGLRIAGVRFDASLYSDDPITGWSLRPGAEGWWVSEGHAFVRINGAGMHDREYSLRKPKDIVRIAVLGDSVTAAVQVDVEENFTRVLERTLNRCGAFPGKKVEVMNFGVPGFGTAQELLTFRHRVLPYQPDAVMLALYTYNDIQNNERSLNPVDASRSPYFIVEHERLTLDDSFRAGRSRVYGPLRNAFGNAVNHSRVLQLVAEVVIRQGFTRFRKQRENNQLAARFGHAAEHLIYAPPHRQEMKDAWQVTESLILALNHDVTSYGMKFWLATLSQSPQHVPPPIREELVRRWGIGDLFYPDRRLEAFAARHGIPAIILAPVLADYVARHPQNLSFMENGYGHYNEAGHRIVGETIGKSICAGF